jgi:hypothetical protein
MSAELPVSVTKILLCPSESQLRTRHNECGFPHGLLQYCSDVGAEAGKRTSEAVGTSRSLNLQTKGRAKISSPFPGGHCQLFSAGSEMEIDLA